MTGSSATSVGIFISYAREDETWLQELDKHFGVLYNKGLITPFDDRQITIGDKWNEVLIRKIKEADLIVLIVTAEFLRSSFIHRVELQHALEQHRANQCWLLPIIFSPCYWEEEEFAEVQVYPRSNGPKFKPVDKWTDFNEPLVEITEQLSKWAKNRLKEKNDAKPTAILQFQPELYPTADGAIALSEQTHRSDLLKPIMGALRQINVDRADGSAIAVIAEAAKLVPAHLRPDGREYDQEISTSRLFLGALHVGNIKLKNNKEDRSWLAGLAKAFSDEADSKIQNFCVENRKRFNDDELGARSRLSRGFSTNSRKILEHATEEARSLRGDAIAFTIMFPHAGLLHKWLKDFKIDVEYIRSFVESYTKS